MPKIPIQGKALKHIREKLRMSQVELESKSTVSAKTIRKVEMTGEGLYELRSERAEKLARALRLPMETAFETLSGEKPYERVSAASPDAEVRLNYELVWRRYGVDKAWLQRYAPIMFAALAGQYIKHREEQRSRIRGEFANILDEVACLGNDARSNAFALIRDIGEAASSDPFASVMAPMGISVGEPDENGLEDYDEQPALLSYIARQGLNVGYSSIPGYETSGGKASADFGLFFGQSDSVLGATYLASLSALEEIVGDSLSEVDDDGCWDWELIDEETQRAVKALTLGVVSVSDIPDEYHGYEHVADRRAWLAEKYSAYEKEHLFSDISPYLSQLREEEK